ncbi:NlpC/P60 family protein [Galactobacter sp.]|uniref:C40 family peptidase n=1 Tax=Galactobacter sp. TaxID=2676125 RepID=UPI0025BAC239|nr:NlpC/P60 family protein [Galactobacter sp.]
MTKRVETVRHRAASTGTFEQLSKAVASNAGTMSRQAAVVAAAGGLVVTLGVSGSAAHSKTQAAPKADVTSGSTDFQRVAQTDIHAAAVNGAPQVFSLVKVVASPAPEQPATKSGPATLTVKTPAPATERPATEQPATERPADDSAAESSPSKARPTVQTRTEKTPSSPANKSTSASKPSTPTTTVGSASTEHGMTASGTTSTASSSNGAGLAATAKSGLGVPYRLGGNTTSGWDCSGFVRWVYAQNGKNISARTASGIWKGGQFKATNNPKPGDIIIQRGGAHVAIYMGGGKYIGAQNPSVGTTWRDLGTTTDSFNGYYTWVG